MDSAKSLAQQDLRWVESINYVKTVKRRKAKHMNTKEFLEKIKSLNVAFTRKTENKSTYGGKYFTYNCLYKKELTMKDGFYCKWVSGGQTGGSCWDTGDAVHRPVSADQESEDLEKYLEEVLGELCPNLSFLQYKRLMRDLVERGETSESEYYGNYTEYSFKWAPLQKIYDRLVEMNVL